MQARETVNLNVEMLEMFIPIGIVLVTYVTDKSEYCNSLTFCVQHHKSMLSKRYCMQYRKEYFQCFEAKIKILWELNMKKMQAS
jgi:hypothetical protein